MPRPQSTCLNITLPSQFITLQLLKTKCIPILLYGLEVETRAVTKSQLSSVDFAINRFFMKLL